MTGRAARTRRTRRCTCAVALLAAAGFAAPAGAGAPGQRQGQRQIVSADSTPDITEVSDLAFEVSRIEFSLANLDGTVIVTDGSRFRLDADVLFRFDRADLSPKADALIADVAAQLRAAKPRSVRVDGYTDDTGDAAYNLGLSRRRAQAVADALRGRLRSGVTLRVTGHGEAAPVADNATEAGQARNRRVTVTIDR